MTWSLAAIYLCTEYFDERTRRSKRISATAVANAIEALACKAMYDYASRDTFAYYGSRVFGRECTDGVFEKRDKWTFAWLSQTKNYVQNTYRQSASAAIYALKLTEGSSRFNSMRLTQEGRSIALEFLQQKIDEKALISYLTSWIRNTQKVLPANSSTWKKFLNSLNPKRQTTTERNLYTRVFNNKVRYNGRQILLPLMKVCNTEKDLLDSLERSNEVRYRTEILAAKAFDDFHNAVKILFSGCIGLMDSNIFRLKDIEGKLQTEIALVKAKGETYLKFKEFAYGNATVGAMIRSKFKDMLDLIISNNKAILVKTDMVMKGPLYVAAKDWASEQNNSKDNDNEWPLSRLRQWRNLCIDCGVCR
ncbi:hypothetical protein SAMN05720766_12016 [Fibrobacter sp. UWH9]|nr:hypothetical protein SAMN05720766_12016 [Fibrobacter sp. UWH9]